MAKIDFFTEQQKIKVPNIETATKTSFGIYKIIDVQDVYKFILDENEYTSKNPNKKMIPIECSNSFLLYRQVDSDNNLLNTALIYIDENNYLCLISSTKLYK